MNELQEHLAKTRRNWLQTPSGIKKEPTLGILPSENTTKPQLYTYQTPPEIQTESSDNFENRRMPTYTLEQVQTLL